MMMVENEWQRSPHAMRRAAEPNFHVTTMNPSVNLFIYKRESPCLRHGCPRYSGFTDAHLYLQPQMNISLLPATVGYISLTVLTVYHLPCAFLSRPFVRRA